MGGRGEGEGWTSVDDGWWVRCSSSQSAVTLLLDWSPRTVLSVEWTICVVLPVCVALDAIERPTHCGKLASREDRNGSTILLSETSSQRAVRGCHHS